MKINNLNINNYNVQQRVPHNSHVNFRGSNNIPHLIVELDFNKLFKGNNQSDVFEKEQQCSKERFDTSLKEETSTENDYDSYRLLKKAKSMYNALSREDKQEYDNYFKKIDFNKLSRLAPQIKQYNEYEKQIFGLTHFVRAKNNNPFNTEIQPFFTIADLVYSEDLTQNLKDKFINATEMDEILIAYPRTERTIGELPLDWESDSIDNQELLYSISDVISDFTINKDEAELEEQLSILLKRRCNISKINEGGSYGVCYKIDADGAMPLCLKIFKDIDKNNCDDIFGKCVEPQIGIYGNEHSNELVKMFFGKIAREKDLDGFIVTQFLDENIKPIQSKNRNSFSVEVHDIDRRASNFIQNKIIDFGGILFLRFTEDDED